MLLLAAFNLTFRLTQENVAEWDESLYAGSAIEMLESGDWVGTTTQGALDYYNSKPPLHVWILALSFKVFGTNLLSLRLVAAASAWLTVFVLLWWAHRTAGPTAALLSALVLSTSFGFLHVHSGRSGNPDALLTLLLLLIVVVEWTAARRASVLVWLGPLLAGVFLLKGMALLMPLAFIVAVETWRALRGRAIAWRPLALAAVLFVAPVLCWTVARWRLDEWRFLRLLVTQDLVAVSTTPTDGHVGSPLYYLDILQRHHYEWLVAVAVAVAVARPRLVAVRALLADGWRSVWDGCRRGDDLTIVVCLWVLVAFGVPTLMQTKLPWYLNPLYPMFALGAGWLLARALSETTVRTRPRWAIVAVLALALGIAEGKLIWHSVNQRALEGSAQELVMHAADDLRGRVVYRNGWTWGESFVVRGIVKAEHAVAADVDRFLEAGSADDFLLAEAHLSDPRLLAVRANGAHALFRRRRLVDPAQ